MSATLIAVPNISEGRDLELLRRIGEAFEKGGARLLDMHADADHHRAVFSLAGASGSLSEALMCGFEIAAERIDISDGRGEHPHVGAIDVAPIVYLSSDERGAAAAEALVLADLIGEELSIPVLLYGELAGGRSRAQLRRGGRSGLAQRLSAGQLSADFGPREMHESAGATLVAARPPLVAFNLELSAPAGAAEARRIAALIREGGEEGIAGLRAIGIALRRAGGGEVGQVSMNIEDPKRLPLAKVVAAVRRHCEVASGELVGLAPAAAFEGFPADLPMPGFECDRQLIENALGL